VRIVRKMVPLPMHAYAVPAAMAWCSADAQGKGDAMAKELFAAKPEDLTPAGCEAIAVRLGCDVMKYRETFASAELRARIEKDMADAKAANLNGFPTIFIGAQKFEGSDHTPDVLLAAIERARH
jgi:predicted DsbA family dithiol-disulfide isomerase